MRIETRTLDGPGQRTHSRERRRHRLAVAHPRGMLQRLDRLYEVDPQLGGQPAGAVLADRLGHLGGATQEVHGLALRGETTRRGAYHGEAPLEEGRRAGPREARFEPAVEPRGALREAR